MKALWSGQFKYISPRDFKITIGKINDQFSGYKQQDSQELLLFLMDGLHEDLNKVTSAQKLETSRYLTEHERVSGVYDPPRLDCLIDNAQIINHAVGSV